MIIINIVQNNNLSSIYKTRITKDDTQSTQSSKYEIINR